MYSPDMKLVPAEPGVYLMKDKAGRIIYVGKAKHLRKRVGSYFRSGADHTPKTRAMVAQVASLDTLCTSSEKEALLLEASLIKKHRPRYNIVLRDDKQYVLFRLDKMHPYPRLTVVRRVVRDGSLYYGPFTSGVAARDTWKAIHKVFPLRRCTDRAFENRVRPCLYHDIKLCPAPCVLDVDPQVYADMVRRIEMLLSGRSSALVSILTNEMEAASENMEFEEAAMLRDQIRAVQATIEQQAVVLAREVDLDVLGVSVVEGAEGQTGLALSVLFVRKGRLLDKKTMFWPGVTMADQAEAVSGFLMQFYGVGMFVPERVVVPESAFTQLSEQDDAIPVLEEALADRREAGVRISIPRGDMERRLMDMATVNASEHARKMDETPILRKLQVKLKLAQEPYRIECVDVSHTGGEQARVGMVVFEDGKAAKKEYRLYDVDDVGGDDYGALAQWAYRRGKRMLDDEVWPDMVLIDGGKGQLAAVERGFAEVGLVPPPLVAIAKEHAESGAARRHAGAQDVIFLAGRVNPVPMKSGASELLFLQLVRDTAHDYVIGRHRKARQKAALQSTLMDLKGVGPATARELWNMFSSLEEMGAATVEQLQQLPGYGPQKAARLHNLLSPLRASESRGEVEAEPG